MTARREQPCGEHHEQAHLPAEQPSPRQEARLPPPHADACRPRHPVGASRQGPHRALGLIRLIRLIRSSV
ncbi:hypothetical protein CURTO8I2_70374 [Curtobacterium sp. 8I-2]|nr:hypothetical protein CURTO8I2_70374 [Curtobacterium sp. 8I-2]